ncbi:ATP-binding protein [Asticcacaulis sp. EMRT-3]|uniref:ATP-binding protein n=1 Tax=Asticcacaulis sp. EMRT-3 TaxID=3040349 RepID=UPI0024AFB96D|nr:ATP-binding protein [Asticcacaulis sp. EMRT-3]MDI7775777.1 ATP-binding protein [Asticcacaulis sp. EMRT-3]
MPASRPKHRSLTARLLAGVVLPIIAIVVLIGVVANISAHSEINEVYDAQLATAANFLRYYNGDIDNGGNAAIGTLSSDLSPVARHGLAEYSRWRRFRVWRDGRLVLMAGNARPVGAPLPPGYSDLTDADGQWRYFTLYLPESHEVIAVGENIKARGELIARVFWGLVLPLSLALPLLGLAVWLGIVWGLKDLRSFAASVRERSADHLTPIDTQSAPAELQTLAASINGLLTTIAASLEQERLFTDNAAHELRTPLAVVKTQTEVVTGARNAQERKAALAELTKGVDRAARLMDQLLTMARLRQNAPPVMWLSLSQCVSDAVRDLYPEAHARRIGFHISGEAQATANLGLVGIILRNLIDNAIKYAPEGSDIDIAMSQGAICLRDRGPGIAEDEREKVFARFYRIKGSRAQGSGLGLAIVRIAAAQTGAEVRFFTPDDGVGLGVRLNFSI